MRTRIPIIVIALLVLGGCNLPQPVVGNLHSSIRDKTHITKSRATCFPVGDGIWVSTCHHDDKEITEGIPLGTTEIEVGGERFPVIGARFSKKADYCLVAIEDKSHVGFTIASTRPLWGFYKIILSEEGNRTLSAVPCPWPKDDVRPKVDDRPKDDARTEAKDKTGDSSACRVRVWGSPFKASEQMVPGHSGSPVLNGGKVVGLVVAAHEKKPEHTMAVPMWIVFPELEEMATELKREVQRRQASKVPTSQPAETASTQRKE